MSLILFLEADTKKATSQIKGASRAAGKSIKTLEKDSVKSANRMRQSFGGLTGSIGALRNKLLVFGFATAGTIKLFKTLIEASSDLEESVNAVNVVFKNGAGAILDFGKLAAESVGLANAEFNQLATETGALLVNTGIPISEVSDLTIKLTKRAADLASVFNTDVKLAFSAINQAIRGETEAIRKFSGDVTDASLQTFLFAKGLDTLVSSLSQEEKRLLRVDLLLKQTDVTSGDFLNTQDSLANATRILIARMFNLAAEIGDGFVPAASNAVIVFGKLVTVTENYLKLQEKLDKFAGGPLSSEAIERFKLAQEGFKGVSQATQEFLGLIAEVDEAQAHSLTEAGLRTAALNEEIEKLKELTGANEITTFIDGIGRSFEEDILPPMEETVSAIDNIASASEKWADNQAALAKDIPELPKNIKIVDESMELAAAAAENFSQSLARALISGKGLNEALLGAAIKLGLSFIPGGSLFGGFFAHGGNAPGGFVPSIVGEGGGAPEIVQSASPIKVTPLTTNNRFNNSFTIVFPNVREIDDFELQTNIIPKINALVQNGDSRLSATDLAA